MEAVEEAVEEVVEVVVCLYNFLMMILTQPFQGDDSMRYSWLLFVLLFLE